MRQRSTVVTSENKGPAFANARPTDTMLPDCKKLRRFMANTPSRSSILLTSLLTDNVHPTLAAYNVRASFCIQRASAPPIESESRNLAPLQSHSQALSLCQSDLLGSFWTSGVECFAQQRRRECSVMGGASRKCGKHRTFASLSLFY